MNKALQPNLQNRAIIFIYYYITLQPDVASLTAASYIYRFLFIN